MANVEVRGLANIVSGLGELSDRQMNFAIAKTLTNIASIAKDNTADEMKTVFDRPTPFTINSLRIKSATKSDLSSKVFLKDISAFSGPEKHYLVPQTYGGQRPFKAYEMRLYRSGILPRGYYTIPGDGADYDAFGNMSRGQINQILSFFDAFRESGFGANMGPLGRERLSRPTRSRYGIGYFDVQPGARSNLFPGIYKEIFSNFGRAIQPVLIFVRRSVYQKRLDLQRIANQTYSQNFNELFRQNFIDAVNTAIPRR